MTANKTSPFPKRLLAPTAALLQAQIAIDAAITKRATAPLGLEPAIADLLIRLSQATENSLRGVDIGRQLMANLARVSRLIDRAEHQGLVKRLPDPTDRRAQRITLTETGRRTASAFAPLLVEVLQEIIDNNFSKEELDNLISLLNKLTQSASHTAEDTTSTGART